eukprot:NODE_82_length_22625_cov_0.476516.p15 type:complete len:124 gc:universal NODE_82_length_22625_cov_0.476516:2314-2685(+)
MSSCKWQNCDYMAMTAKDLYHHTIQQHVKGAKQCFWETCRYFGDKPGLLYSHIIQHIEYYPYICSNCNRKFKRKHDRRKHLASIHQIYTHDANESISPVKSVSSDVESPKSPKFDVSYLINKD